MTEQEAKFHVLNLSALEQRLQQAGAVLEAPRVFESNLRFDLPDASLTTAHRVLRLRMDTRARLTYKSPMLPGQAVSVREEIEFEVSDFDSARALLEALGYQVSVMYEKYRTTYAFMDNHVTLDELPYGSFVEIEGPGAESILAAARALRLNWQAQVSESYLAIFQRIKQQCNLPAAHLSFTAFAPLNFSPAWLNLTPADRD